MEPGWIARHAKPLRRWAIVLGLAGAALFYGLDWRQRHPPDIQVFDVGRRAHEISAASPAEDSLTDVYELAPGGSAHLHIFGKGITCHLHIHERTEEASIPVMGSPLVTQRFGANGAVDVKTARYGEGTMIVSPPYCAHEWVNTSQTEGHASLVFTLGEAFPGNLFVRPTDPRILRGAAPHIVDPEAELETFARGGERLREVPVPVTLAEISLVLIKDSFAVAAKDRTVTFLYAAAGNGHVEDPEPIALHRETLVVLRKSPALKVVDDGGEPLAFYVVRMPKKDP